MALVAAMASTLVATGCAVSGPAPSREELVRQVMAAETAFARTMADRDHTAFMRFVADDAVFLNGGKPLRGKAAIGEHWKRFYAGPTAPFSWKPDRVEVVASGRLAQSIGPVSDPTGKVIARFYSTWRLEPDGAWRVVLDDGYDVCNCPAPAPAAAPAAAAPGGDQALFAVEITLGAKWDAAKPPQEQAFFREHSAHLKRLRDGGQLVMGARYADKGLVVLAAADESRARALMEGDPSVRAQVFQVSIHPFGVFYGGTVQPRPRRPPP